MGLNLQVMAHPAYLHAKVTGDGTLPATKQAIVGIINAAWDHRLPSMLVDWQCVNGMNTVSTIDRYETAIFLTGQVIRLRGQGLCGIRIANVALKFRRDAEGFSVTVACNRGLDMTIKTTLAEALAWLGIDDLTCLPMLGYIPRQ